MEEKRGGGGNLVSTDFFISPPPLSGKVGHARSVKKEPFVVSIGADARHWADQIKTLRVELWKCRIFYVFSSIQFFCTVVNADFGIMENAFDRVLIFLELPVLIYFFLYMAM